MPHLLFRGFTVDEVKQASTPLATELAHICECEEDNFFFEVLPTTSIIQGEITKGYPFLEIAWFDRGVEIQDKIVQAVTTYFLNAGLEEIEIVFVTYDARNYYYNGKHFA